MIGHLYIQVLLYFSIIQSILFADIIQILISAYLINDGHFIFLSLHLFKMDWLLMSIVLLCIMAIVLYAVIGVVEKIYQKRI